MKPKSILIIDDSSFDRAILAKVLSERLDCTIREASGSAEAFQILSQSPVDMILIDVEMPGMSGDEVVLKIRETKGADELPIIMVSGNSQVSVVVKCLQSGANDYIEKPVNFEVAVMRILNHLRLADSIQYKVHLNELAAVNAMITTYHHEINNPLTIAKMELAKLKKVSGKNESLDHVANELNRIAEVVQKIQDVKQKKSVLFEAYSGKEKMVKVK